MKNTNIMLNEDQKTVVNREIKLAQNTLATLLHWVNKGSLSEDMKETLPILVDTYMGTVKEAIGFTGEESDQEKEMTESIGHYYQGKIKALEKALEEQQSIASISGNVSLLFKKISKWWNVEGFHYVREKSITHSGSATFELGFMLNSMTSMFSKTPVSDKQGLQTKVQYLTEKGFEFAPKMPGSNLDLIDNDNNRNLLHDMIKQAFPSARAYSFNNQMLRANDEKDDCFIIRGVEVTIHDLSDVENLQIEEKNFSIDEDDF